jgi:hypothetical protein
MSEKVLPVSQRRTAIPAVGTIEHSFAAEASFAARLNVESTLRKKRPYVAR